jgi:ATP-binding cassette subfamily B multidrug efflux pump
MSKVATATADGAAESITNARPGAKPYLSLDDRENDLGRGLNRESAQRLLAFLRPYRAQCALSLVAITVQTLGELALPRLLGIAIDRGIARDSTHTLFVAVGAFLACVLIVFGARWTQGYTTTRIGNRVIFDLRYALFRHIQILGFKTFDRMGVGRLISRVQNDVSVLQDLLTDGIIGLFADLLVLVGIIIAMLTINVELALLSYIVLPMMVVIVMIWRRFAIRVYRAVRAATSRLTGYSAENISGMRAIQSFRREQENFNRFERLNRNVYDQTTHSIRLNSRARPQRRDDERPGDGDRPDYRRQRRD